MCELAAVACSKSTELGRPKKSKRLVRNPENRNAQFRFLVFFFPSLLSKVQRLRYRCGHSRCTKSGCFILRINWSPVAKKTSCHKFLLRYASNVTITFSNSASQMKTSLFLMDRP